MGYLHKHWRGELSLAVSFWVNFMLVNGLLGGAMVLNTQETFTDHPVVLCRVMMSLAAMQLLVLFPWQIVGLWRAGTHRAECCGRHGLSVTLKLFLVLMLLYHIAETIDRWDVYRETFKVAFLKEDVPACTLTLKANETVLHLDGGLGFGVSKQFVEVLRQHPDIETVIVDSTGGRLYEARKMADQILEHRLNTTTVSGCYSAGNLLFAAGENRTLCKGARLGFHEYYYPEPFRDYVDVQAEYRKDWGFYQLRGVTKEFQEKLFSAEPNDFWCPTEQELLDGGMIHAVVELTEILPIQEAILLGFDTSGTSLPQTSAQATTAEQVKGWILGCSSVLWERNRDDFVTLAGKSISPMTVQDQKKSLSEWWGVKNRQELLKELMWLTQKGGHRDGFARDGRWASMMTDEELEEYLKPYEQYAEKCNELRMAHEYYESLGDKSILGWDLSRYMCLCRWGYLCGWLDGQEAWELMIPVARRLQETFDSWEDLGQNYLIGRQYWSLKQTQQNGELYEEAFDRLCEMPSSPWNQYPWDLDLSGAYVLVVDPLSSASAETKPAEPVSRPEREITVPQVDMMPVIEAIDISEPNLAGVNRLEDLEKDGPVRVVPDAYATIQSAIDAAESGDTVFIREGVYDEWIWVEDRHNVRIVGEGARKVAWHVTDPNKNEIMCIQNCEQITISDVTIEDARQKDPKFSKSAIRIHDASVDFVRCRIVNRQGCGINYYSGGKGEIRETLVESCAVEGAILLDETTEVTVRACCFRENQNDGILAYRGLTLHVQDSLFERNGAGIFVSEEGSSATVSGCLIRENTDRGIIVANAACVTVENTTIELNENIGIHATNEHTCLHCTHSQSCLNQKAGMFVDKGAAADIRDCMTAENKRDGILLKGDSTTVMINGFRSFMNSASGVWIDDGAHVTIQESICRGNKESGINISNGGIATIEKCLLAKNKFNGVFVHGSGTKAAIRDSQCVLNVKGGIRIYDAAFARVQNNDCEQNQQNGIEVYRNGATATLENNRCFNNKVSGISFSSSGQGTIVECICEMNQKNGIAVYEGGTRAELKDNHCIQNGQNGILFNTGAISTVEYCVCEKNVYSGIQVRDEKTRVDLNGNECRFNRWNGIVLSDNAGPSVTLTANVCLNNYPSGIYLLDGAGGNLHGNRCADNPWAGIAIEGEGTMPVIDENELSGNGTWGIRVWGGAAPVLGDNVLENNGKGMLFVEPQRVVGQSGD